jgi:hypothetical protein
MWRVIVAGVLSSALSFQAHSWAGELTKAEEFLEAQLKECKTQCDTLKLALRDLRKADSAKRQPAQKDVNDRFAAIPSPAPAAPAAAPAPVPQFRFANSWCSEIPNRVFVRADPLDNFHYALDPNARNDAKGATVSYTNDQVAAKQTATIDGRVSFMLLGASCDPLPDATHPFGNRADPYFAGLVVAPFVSSNGTWNEPLPTKLSNSNIKVGSDFMVQSRLDSPFISAYFYVSPYYQTDYQNRASIEGSVFALEPVIPAIFLNSSQPTPYFSFFWQWRGEIDTVHVTVPGLTNLSVGDHLWVGETVVANFALFPPGQPFFPNKFFEDYVDGRFSLIGTAKTFYDTRTGTNADYYSAMLQYKLGECKAASGSDPSSPCAVSGSSSISFEYDTGVDKDTLVKTRQYLVKLGYAY